MTTNDSAPKVSRRPVLGGIGATGAAVALGAPAARAATRPGAPTTRHADVVVVGAGIAGLTTARLLRAAGMSVIVVEARTRVGGRTLNQDLAANGYPGRVVEMGGQFAGPFPGEPPVSTVPGQAVYRPQNKIVGLARQLASPPSRPTTPGTTSTSPTASGSTSSIPTRSGATPASPVRSPATGVRSGPPSTTRPTPTLRAPMSPPRPSCASSRPTRPTPGRPAPAPSDTRRSSPTSPSTSALGPARPSAGRPGTTRPCGTWRSSPAEGRPDFPPRGPSPTTGAPCGHRSACCTGPARRPPPGGRGTWTGPSTRRAGGGRGGGRPRVGAGPPPPRVE